MATNLIAIYNELNELISQKNEYSNMRGKIVQLMNQLNSGQRYGQNSLSMFRRSYSESNTSTRKAQELEREINKMANVISNTKSLIDMIDMKIKEISNKIEQKKEQIKKMASAAT